MFFLLADNYASLTMVKFYRAKYLFDFELVNRVLG